MSRLSEEDQVRRRFNAEYGAHLPEDICLCIGNPPTRWEVAPWPGDSLEILPRIDEDLLVEVWLDGRLEVIYRLTHGSGRLGKEECCDSRSLMVNGLNVVS